MLHYAWCVALWCATLAVPAGVAVSATPGGSIGATSDYVLRGISQSNGAAALQGELHWSFLPGWSSGFLASQVQHLPHQTTLELGEYLQWHDALSADLDLGVAATNYHYPHDPRPISYSYDELSLSLAWRDQIYLALSWTPKLNLYSLTDGLARDRQVYTFEASVHRNLRPRLDLTAGIGFYDPAGLEYAAYGYGNLALAWHYDHWRADLAWIWVQNASHRQYSAGPAGGPLAATLAWSF